MSKTTKTSKKAKAKSTPRKNSKSSKTSDGPYFPVCPRCGSLDVKSETNPAYAITGLMTVFKQCNACGYHGLVFPEVLASQVRKPIPPEKIESREMVQTSYGRGYWKYLVYIALPMAILMAAIFLL